MNDTALIYMFDLDVLHQGHQGFTFLNSYDTTELHSASKHGSAKIQSVQGVPLRSFRISAENLVVTNAI